MTTSLNFFKQYHSTVIKALGEDAKKVNAKGLTKNKVANFEEQTADKRR